MCWGGRDRSTWVYGRLVYGGPVYGNRTCCAMTLAASGRVSIV
jgi:hypothetical protein